MDYAVGVDIGSLTAKSVIIDPDCNIVSYKVIQGKIVDEAAAIASLRYALDEADLTEEKIGFMVTTGYGRRAGSYTSR